MQRKNQKQLAMHSAIGLLVILQKVDIVETEFCVNGGLSYVNR